MKIFDYEHDQMMGWLQLLGEKYEHLSLDEIALAEGIHIMREDIEESHKWIDVDNTQVVILNRLLSDEDQRNYLLAAVAARRVYERKEVVVRISTN